MINPERYSEVKDYIENGRFDLTDNEIQLNADMIEIIGQLTNNKLSTKELLETVDFLSDLIKNKNPKLLLVEKNDRIKVQFRVMEGMQQVAGKLTPQEKEYLAFCVFWAYCVAVYDDENDITLSGLVDFTSVKKMKNEFKHYKKIRPDFFPNY